MAINVVCGLGLEVKIANAGFRLRKECEPYLFSALAKRPVGSITGRVPAPARPEPGVYHDRPIRTRVSELTPRPFSSRQTPQPAQAKQPPEADFESALARFAAPIVVAAS